MALVGSTHMVLAAALSPSPSWRPPSMTSAVSFRRCPVMSLQASLFLKNQNQNQEDLLLNTRTTRRRRGPPCLAMGESNHTFSDVDQQILEEHCNKSLIQSAGVADSDYVQEETITLGFIQDMIADFRNRKLLDKKFAYEIVNQARDLFRPLPSLVDITVPDGKHITVCGDLHGQFDDLLHIFELNGLPSENNPYIFNGDFVDRGLFSVEVILTLFSFKCLFPSAIYLTRGNHESRFLNMRFGFHNELKFKLGEEFIEQFDQVFQCLPLAHVINQKIFVVHGGLSTKDGVKLDHIRSIDQFCEPPMNGLGELLWNDPGGPEAPGRGYSMRGGFTFGVDVTNGFLQDNNLELVIRSHEVKSEGYEVEHDGKLITVFSASNYCGMRGNKGAFVRFAAPEMKPEMVTFSATDLRPHA